MARTHLHLLCAVVALTAALALPPAGRGQPQPPAVPASDFAGELDALLAQWSRTGLSQLAAQQNQPARRALALALAAFLEGDYRAAVELARQAAASTEEPVRRRGEWTMELASAWQTVWETQPAMASGDGIVLRVPPDEQEWGRLVAGLVKELVTPYFDYFRTHPEGTLEVVFLSDVEQLAKVAGISSSKLHKSGTVAVTLFGRIFLLSPSTYEYGYAWDIVLGHETVHLLIHRLVPRGFPHFLEEALASLLETLGSQGRLRPLSDMDRAVLALAQEQGLLSSMETLNKPYWNFEEPLAASAASLQVLVVGRLIAQKGGPEAPAQVVRGLAEGASWQEAVSEAAGTSADWIMNRAPSLWKSLSTRERVSDYLFAYARKYLSERARRVVEQARQTVLLGDLLWGRGKTLAALRSYLLVP